MTDLAARFRAYAIPRCTSVDAETAQLFDEVEAALRKLDEAETRADRFMEMAYRYDSKNVELMREHGKLVGDHARYLLQTTAKLSRLRADHRAAVRLIRATDALDAAVGHANDPALDDVQRVEADAAAERATVELELARAEWETMNL